MPFSIVSTVNMQLLAADWQSVTAISDKNLKNVNTFDKTRTHCFDFELEGFEEIITCHKKKSGVQNAIYALGVY